MSPLERPTGFSSPDHLRTLRRRRLQVSSGAVLLLVFGLLLWARFILVTGHPKTALAEPPAESPVHAATDSDKADPSEREHVRAGDADGVAGE